MTYPQFTYVPVGDVDIAELLSRLESAPAVSVLVPVHKAPDAVARCLAALQRHLPAWARLIVIDDASDDARVDRLLERLPDRFDNVVAARNPENLGFTRTVNRGFELAGTDDVLILNSDTHVGPGWLGFLRTAAYSHPRVATVSAVSNWAGTMSVPEPHRENVWHPRRPWEEVSRIVAHGMPVWRQEVPAGHGFCMYVRREALDELDGLDSDAFPRGYGEEVDFSQRAIAAGFVNFVAPRVMVHHLRGQSFGSERNELAKAGKVVLQERHPALQDEVKEWGRSVGDLLIRRVARRLRTSAHEVCERPVVVAAAPTRGRRDDHVLRLDREGRGAVRTSCQPGCLGHAGPPTWKRGAQEDLGLFLARVLVDGHVEQVDLTDVPEDWADALRRAAEVLGIPVHEVSSR